MAPLIAEQLEFDFFSSPVIRNTEKPDWLVKAENLVSTLVGPQGTTFVLPKNRYESVSAWRDYSDIDKTHVYQRSIKLSDAGFLGSGKFIKNENGKVRLLTDEDELIISSHLAKQGFLVSQYPDNSWRFQKKFFVALRNRVVSPFPEPLKDYSDTLYRYFLNGMQYGSFDPKVRNLGDPSITEIEQPEYFSRWFGFEPFIDKVTQDIRTYSTVAAGPIFNRYLTDNQYLDFDRELYGKKAFFSEKFKEDMKQGTLAPFPPELSELNPFKEELFNDIGRVFGIDTPKLAKEVFSKHPIYQWVKENTPGAEVDPTPILKALERPGVLPLSEKKDSYLFRNPEERFRSGLRTYRNNKALDEKGEQLLEKAGRLNMFLTIAEYASQAVENSKLRIDAEYRNNLFELSRKADDAFFKYRDSLKHNKDGSLKLEDFGEDLNNTRKGRSIYKSTDAYQFLSTSQEDIAKRLSSEPLEKVWPKSSILELHKDNPEAAACLWLVRSTLSGRRPAKGTFKFRRYLHTASAAIALHRQVVSGELAPEAAVEAFDQFYEATAKYKVLAHISPKYWPFIGAYSIRDAQNICRWNGLRLSDDTDIDTYQYQCLLPGSRENNHLCLKNHDGKLFPYFAVAVGNSEKEFEANIEKQLSAIFGKLLDAANQPEKGNESKPKLSIELYGRGSRSTHTYEIYGKAGTIEFQLSDKIAFESDEAFWEYLKNHRTELENKYQEFRTEFSKTEKDWRSGSPIRDRVGPDYRKGKDATPEMFMNTFGFRGVEFGNWVKQGKNGRERQWMLNNAYDSLLDLSKILGIPPKAVALDGELGLCFGSRGHGSASAHYEPTNRLINLTKTKGYSCLAHEWFHALDHYLMRTNYREKLDVRMLSEQVDSEVIFKLTPEAQERINEGGKKLYSLWMGSASRLEYELKTNPKSAELARKVVAGELDQADINLEIPDRGRELTYKVTLTKKDLLQTERGVADKIRPELHHAWAETIDTIRSTAMHRRMLKKKAYWHSKKEEAARSFEAFVEVRSKELGITNDFLTNGAFVEKTLDKESFYPYLDGEDIRRVSDKFKALFGEIRTKETNKGVALFSKTREGKSGAKISEIKEALDKKFGKTTIDALIDNGRLKIVSDINDVLPHLSPLPEELKNSQKNTKTGFIVPDELAHESNTTGCIAVFHPTVTGDIPSGEIVVPPGHHRPFIHSGKGARHLTGSVIEDPKRNLYPQEENKTEASLKTVLQVLASANEIYKEGQGKNDSYHFYSRKLGLAVCTYFDGNKFVVLTQKPVKNPENIWGKKIGGLKGALEFPFNRDSVHLSPSIQDAGGNQTEHQPATAHEATYTSVDYTAKIFSDIQRAKNRYTSEDIKGVQGFYSSELKTSFLIADNLLPEAASSVLLHEVGIHMAYDSELKEKVIPLVKEAPRLLEEGFRQRDPVCMAAEIRLKDSVITKDHPNYAEETAAYLVEECSKQRNALPMLQRWYKQIRSAVSVWLVEHGFRDSKTLTTDDFVTIAKANLKTLAEQKELTASQTKNEKIHFSLNKQHQETLELMRKELPKADPAMQNPKVLGKVLQAVEERMRDCERQGKILKVNSEFFKRQTSAGRSKTDQKIPEQNKTKGLER